MMTDAKSLPANAILRTDIAVTGAARWLQERRIIGLSNLIFRKPYDYGLALRLADPLKAAPV